MRRQETRRCAQRSMRAGRVWKKKTLMNEKGEAVRGGGGKFTANSCKQTTNQHPRTQSRRRDCGVFPPRAERLRLATPQTSWRKKCGRKQRRCQAARRRRVSTGSAGAPSFSVNFGGVKIAKMHSRPCDLRMDRAADNTHVKGHELADATPPTNRRAARGDTVQYCNPAKRGIRRPPRRPLLRGVSHAAPTHTHTHTHSAHALYRTAGRSRGSRPGMQGA